MFTQQRQFLLLLGRLVPSGNREAMERDAEPLGHRLELGVVTDDERDLHLPLSGPASGQDVVKAVG